MWLSPPKGRGRQNNIHRFGSKLSVLSQGYNVAVVDCDYPQHSISAMRKRDAEQVNGDDYYKQLAFSQFKTLGKKAYPVLCSSPDEAIKTADEFLASAGSDYDVVFSTCPER